MIDGSSRMPDDEPQRSRWAPIESSLRALLQILHGSIYIYIYIIHACPTPKVPITEQYSRSAAVSINPTRGLFAPKVTGSCARN